MDKINLCVDWIKARVAERTSWDGGIIIAAAVMVLVATPIIKFLAWPALIYGAWTFYKGEQFFIKYYLTLYNKKACLYTPFFINTMYETNN